ncbi:carbohydrate ABC transporter permease [Nonomuraea sp. K274]|uniref:Carbohydrate ABC transporter permease n=1 Tax=Nonomuraea cypriaca TaxID=1187855 RepID=A0A931F2D1_9ACTN|nr:carbohydrate ABC transporter permease [Nonomuraea cypriaca]MBF8191420.1 carbohydrate ABC transporter permease [Nonomuraea cypriaca]
MTARPFRFRAAVSGTTYHLFSGVLAAIFLLPLIWVALNSVKSPEEANQQPPTWFPRSLSLDSFRELATYGEGIGVYLTNSLVLCLLVVAGSTIVCVLAGYGFARFEFRGKKLLFGATLLILMVPYATILLPLYIVLGWLQLTDTVFGLSLVLIMFQLPFGVFLMRNSFESIPRELEEAALVDGCGNTQALRHISLRLVAPGVVTVALFSFIASWNEFLAPLIFLNDGAQYTLPVMLVSLQSGAYGVVDYGALQAGVVLAVGPVLIVYLLLQRYYVAGLINGALRG